MVRLRPFLIPIIAMGLSSPGPALAQAGSAIGTARATVVSPLSAVAVDDLDFGTVAVTAAQGGSVVISPGGGPPARYAGSARPACRSGRQCAAPHPARFRVTGEEGRDYRIVLPVAVAARADGGGAVSLAVEALTVRSASRPGDGAQGRLDAAGTDSFEVGGTIRIPAGATPDRYRAVVDVVLTYG